MVGLTAYSLLSLSCLPSICDGKALIRTLITSKGTPKLITGIAWMVGCLASFSSMAIASRELSDTMSIFQILLLRSLVGLAVMLIVARHLVPKLLELRNLRLHAVRNLIHFSAQYCWTVGIVMLPLAQVFALEFTMPIWAALFAWLMLNERITRARMLATAASFIGVLIVLQPGYKVIDPAALIVLMAAAGYGASAVIVKRLTADSSPGLIVLWMMIMQFPMALAAMLLGGDWVTPGWEDAPWIALVGLSMLTAHYSLAQALTVMDASLAIPIDFLRVPLIAILGWLLYGEALSAAVFVGAALIAGSNYMAMRAELRIRKKE